MSKFKVVNIKIINPNQIGRRTRYPWVGLKQREDGFVVPYKSSDDFKRSKQRHSVIACGTKFFQRKNQVVNLVTQEAMSGGVAGFEVVRSN